MGIDYTSAWNDGYNAALDDVKAIGEALIDNEYSGYSDWLVDFLDKLVENS